MPPLELGARVVARDADTLDELADLPGQRDFLVARNATTPDTSGKDAPVIRAMIHKWVTRNSDGHRVWSEEMIWSGERARVWFCTCGEQFWPITKEGPYSDWRDNPIKRKPPD